jgi:sugar phosphate isomerase/epimerase
LASIGYQSIALTIDHHCLNPYDTRIDYELEVVNEQLQQHGLAVVIETGARYLLDCYQKHEPTLVSCRPQDRARRVEFLRRAIDIAARLDAECVSLWSGVVHDRVSDEEAFQRLTNGLADVLDHAQQKEVTVALEPEPGMLVDTMASYAELLQRLPDAGTDPLALRLTLDVGHLQCLGEVITEQIHQWPDRLVNVHIEDMRRGVHEHLMFGEGDIDFPSVIAALAKIKYAGPVNVELSRHSHEGPNAAKQAYDYLRPLIDAAASHRQAQGENAAHS